MPGRGASAGEPGARRRFPVAAGVVAALLAVAALVWLLVAVPALVKYPTDVEASPAYEGTFTLFVNPTSAAPLAQPLVLPLTVARHVQAVPDQSTSSRVLVREMIDQHAGTVINTTQTNVYVMDRSSVANVADDRAYAFDPANVVDRSGMYRVHLPFGTAAGDNLPVYSNDTGVGFRLAPDAAAPTSTVEGLELLGFNLSGKDVPVTQAYLTETRKSAPLPETMTLDQLRPHLLAAGVDLDALLAALGPRLSPEDVATLATFATTPVPLEYVLTFNGQVGVESVTGTQVKVDSDETLGVRPRAASVTGLRSLLGRYRDVPAAATADAVLDRMLNGSSLRVFEVKYSQTPASVTDIAQIAASQRRQIQAVKLWVPLGLAVAAVLVFVLGLFLARRRPAGEAVNLVSGDAATSALDTSQSLPVHEETPAPPRSS
jgi:hypothetical protein